MERNKTGGNSGTNYTNGVGDTVTVRFKTFGTNTLQRTTAVASADLAAASVNRFPFVDAGHWVSRPHATIGYHDSSMALVWRTSPERG